MLLIDFWDNTTLIAECMQGNEAGVEYAFTDQFGALEIIPCYTKYSVTAVCA